MNNSPLQKTIDKMVNKRVPDRYYACHATYGMNLKLIYNEVNVKKNGVVEIICDKYRADVTTVRRYADSPYHYPLAIYDDIGDLLYYFEKAYFVDAEVIGRDSDVKTTFKIKK